MQKVKAICLQKYLNSDKIYKREFVLRYLEFKNGLNAGQEYAVYLLEGEDAFFRESGVSLLKNKFISNPELNLVNLPAESDVSEIISSLEGYPFMSKKRMTILREFYPKKAQLKNGLASYLENPFLSSVLVIVNQKPCEELNNFDSVCLVDCSKADVSLIIRWIKAECAGQGVNVDGETAKLISEYCLCDMTRIKTETQKLIDFVGNGGEITKQTVENLVSKDLEYKIYELTEHIGKKNFDKALLIIKDMLNKGEMATRLLSYIYNYFRRLLHVAISSMEGQELAKAFGVKEYAITKMKSQSAMFKKRALKSAVDMLSDADYKIKSGLCDAGDFAYLTIFKIMTDE